MEGGRSGEGEDECLKTALNGRSRASKGVEGFEGRREGERWQLLTALNGRPEAWRGGRIEV